MDNLTDKIQEQPKGRRFNYAVAFAFGLGVSFGAAISSWITRMLTY